MADTQLVLILFAVAGVALSIGLMREYVLPRLYRRRLVHSIVLALDVVRNSRHRDHRNRGIVITETAAS